MRADLLSPSAICQSYTLFATAFTYEIDELLNSLLQIRHAVKLCRDLRNFASDFDLIDRR